MEYITEWVGRLVAYLIFESVVLNLLHGKNYIKYVRLIMGVILIVFLTEPLLELVSQAQTYDFHLKRYLSASESEDNSFIYEMHGVREKMMFQELEEQIKKRIETIVLQNGLEITEIIVEFGDDAGYGIPERIQLSLLSFEQNTEMFVTESPAAIQVRNKVAEEFNMEKEKIIIEVLFQ